MRNLGGAAFALWLAILGSQAVGADLPSPRFKSGDCVIWTNLGRVGVASLENTCSDRKMIQVLDYRAGRPIGERWFHLERAEVRDVRIPGDLNVIDHEEDWRAVGDNAMSHLRVTRQSSGGYAYWETRNRSGVYYLAFITRNRTNGTDAGSSWATMEPGGYERIWGAFEDQNPTMDIVWAVFDPL